MAGYQTEGLLPPPMQVGRVAEYGHDHRRRLEVIVRLAKRGFGINAIREVLDSHARRGTIDDLIGLDSQLESPQGAGRCTRDEARARYGLSDELLDLAVAAGLLRGADEGGFEVVGEARLGTSVELQQLGVPLQKSLRLLAELTSCMRPVADGAVRAVAEDVWRPYVEQGLPQAETASVSAALSEIRRLSNRAVVLTRSAALDDALERAAERAAATRRSRST